MSAPQTPVPVGSLNRREVVAALLADRAGLLVVSGLGSSSYDVHAAGDVDGNYYLWGAMGGAALVGYGLARARPERRVLVLTGDGEMLMGMGSLATIGSQRAANLTIVVLDNGHFGETGMQTSHTSKGIDLAAIAAVCGFSKSECITTERGLVRLCDHFREAHSGPQFYVVKVDARNLDRSLPPRDAVFIKNRFRASLGLPVG